MFISIQKLFRYLLFIWILLLLFLMLVLKSNMIFADNKNTDNDNLQISLFDLFFNFNDVTPIDFSAQKKLKNTNTSTNTNTNTNTFNIANSNDKNKNKNNKSYNNDNNNAENVNTVLVSTKQFPQIQHQETQEFTTKLESKESQSEWIDIPLNKTTGNSEVKDISIKENEHSVDVILNYSGELGGYTGASVFANTNKNMIVGKFVDLHGKWTKIEKVFTNTNKNTTKNNLLYDKIRVYTHQNYLRITLESPSSKFSDNNVFKVKVQKNKNADAANKKVKISFYY